MLLKKIQKTTSLTIVKHCLCATTVFLMYKGKAAHWFLEILLQEN